MRHPILTALAMMILTSRLVLAGSTDAGPQFNTIKAIDLIELDRQVKQNGCYVLVFMAAWCAPCIKELPDLNSLYKKYGGHGLRILGISVDFDGPEAMQSIVDKLKITFPIYWLGESAIEAYKVRGIPYLIFIRDGAITETLLGQRTQSYLERKMETFLDDPQSSCHALPFAPNR